MPGVLLRLHLGELPDAFSSLNSVNSGQRLQGIGEMAQILEHMSGRHKILNLVPGIT